MFHLFQTVAFFSHCGMNSVQEAVYHGKPIVGFPNFVDQWDNMQVDFFFTLFDILNIVRIPINFIC